METCNKPVRTVDGDYRPCLCSLGHAGGCNPFSPNPYMAVVIARDQLPKGNKMPLSVESVGIIWTDQSKVSRCLWQGAHGRCMYEIGGHSKHKEEFYHGH